MFRATLLATGIDCAASSGTLEGAVCTATGPVGLGLIAIYSFLIAFVLPLPGEIVLAPASHMRLGIGEPATLAVIIVVSGVAKAAGSVFAFRIGQGVKRFGPVTRWLRRSRFDVIGWTQKRTVRAAKRWGYVGLAVLLSIPFFPDTISIYAFSVLEEDYPKFALAALLGSIGRLLVTLALVGGVFFFT